MGVLKTSLNDGKISLLNERNKAEEKCVRYQPGIVQTGEHCHKMMTWCAPHCTLSEVIQQSLSC